MTEAEFQRLAAQGFNRVPLLAETFADLETPLSLYLKLANRSKHLSARVRGGRRALRALFVHRTGRAGKAARRREPGDGDAWRRHRREVPDRRSARLRARISFALPRRGAPRLAPVLAGPSRILRLRHGALDRTAARRRMAQTRRARCPDMLLLVSEELAVIDNLSGKLYLVVYADPTKPACLARRPSASARAAGRAEAAFVTAFRDA